MNLIRRFTRFPQESGQESSTGTLHSCAVNDECEPGSQFTEDPALLPSISDEIGGVSLPTEAYQVSRATLQEVEEALERYWVDVEAAPLRRSTKQLYVLHSRNFVRWLRNNYQPGEKTTRNSRLST